MLVIVSKEVTVYNIKNNINNGMKENRRKFFKLAGWTSGGLLLWNFFPKSIFSRNHSVAIDSKPKAMIHPAAISRKEKK